jgi:hypothetical protein
MSLCDPPQENQGRKALRPAVVHSLFLKNGDTIGQSRIRSHRDLCDGAIFGDVSKGTRPEMRAK